MVKTFSWCSPLEKTRRKIEAYKGEVKAARRKQQVGCSGLQNKQSPLTSAYPGKGFVSGFLTSFHHSTACGSRGLRLCGLALCRVLAISLRQVPHPAEAVYYHHRHKAFQDLVAFEAGKHYPGGRVENHRNYRKGDDHKKHKNRIVAEHE